MAKPTPTSKDQLTPQQLDFLQRYLSPKSDSYGNAYQSALGAGYSESYATDITVQAPWLKEILGNSDELVSVEEIITGIKKETNTDRAADRLKAWELLGKHKKLFTNKHEHSGPDGQPFYIVDMGKQGGDSGSTS